jgi:hypothetical protein
LERHSKRGPVLKLLRHLERRNQGLAVVASGSPASRNPCSTLSIFFHHRVERGGSDRRSEGFQGRTRPQLAGVELIKKNFWDRRNCRPD